MTPFVCLVPPSASRDTHSQSVSGGSPNAPTFFNAPFAKNPTKRLSGDQNGPNAPAVPGSSRGVTESSARIQSRASSPGRAARKATTRPSGDTAGYEADGLKL